MNKLKELWKKLKSPSAGIIALTFVLSTVFIGFAIYFAVTAPKNVLSYAFYAFSATGLSYSVYLFVLLVPKIKGALVKSIQKNKFTNELLDSFGYRKLVFAIASFILNVLYALAHAVFAVLSRSTWLGALAVYYTALSAIRGGAVSVGGKTRGKTSNEVKFRQINSYIRCGAYLVLLNFALSGALVLTVIQNRGFAYAGILIYVMATYTFFKLTMSIIHIIKLRKSDDFSVKAINNIGFANALVSITALQTAMFAAFSPEVNVRLPNALTGGAVSLLIIALGIYMIISGKSARKKLKSEIKL